jgi:hypothetical protein
VDEVFTNESGTVQFVELFTTDPSETLVINQTLTATSDGVARTFTLHNSLSGSTANHRLLFATAGFASLVGGVTPDFSPLPNRFFNPGAASISISWAGGLDVLSFSGSQLPTDGVHSLNDANPAGIQNLFTATNSPTNFGGNSGSVSVPPLAGDANVDGRVDVNDLARLAAHWLTAGTRADGDFNASGFVDATDLGILALHWREQQPAAGASPSIEDIPPLDDAIAQLGLPAVTVPEPVGNSGSAPLVALAAAAGRMGRGRTKKNPALLARVGL